MAPLFDQRRGWATALLAAPFWMAVNAQDAVAGISSYEASMSSFFATALPALSTNTDSGWRESVSYVSSIYTSLAPLLDQAASYAETNSAYSVSLSSYWHTAAEGLPSWVPTYTPVVVTTSIHTVTVGSNPTSTSVSVVTVTSTNGGDSGTTRPTSSFSAIATALGSGPSTDGGSGSSGIGAGAIAGIVIGAVIAIALIVIAILLWVRHKRRAKNNTTAAGATAATAYGASNMAEKQNYATTTTQPQYYNHDAYAASQYQQNDNKASYPGSPNTQAPRYSQAVPYGEHGMVTQELSGGPIPTASAVNNQQYSRGASPVPAEEQHYELPGEPFHPGFGHNRQ